MSTIIIAKNTTGGDIDLNDLGLSLGPLEILDLTSLFTKSEVIESSDLTSHVENGNIIINDGVSDLSLSDGLMHIRIETEYEDLFEAPAPEGELPITSVNRNTNFPISTVPTAISFNQLIHQNTLSIIEWNISDATKIYLKQSGIYEVIISTEKEITIDVNVTIDIRLNGTLIDTSEITTINDNAYENNDNLSYCFKLENAGYIEVYIYGNQSNGNITKCNVHTLKLQGAKGDKGDPGTGSTIDVMDGVTTYSGINKINFMNFIVSENVTGRADVVFDATSLFNESAVCQIRNTNSSALTTSFTDIPFNTTDIQNDTSVLNHSVTNPDRIIIKKPGLYRIVYFGEFSPTNTNFTNIYARIRKNDNTVLDGGDCSVNFYKGETHDINLFTFQYFQANDYITFQAYADSNVTMEAYNCLSIMKCDAIKGEDGAPGLSGGDTLAAIQLHRTSSLTPSSTTVWSDILFQIKDVETQPLYLEYDIVNTDRVLIKSPGTYKLSYTGNIANDLIECRLRLNDSVVVDGSYQQAKPSSSDLEMLSCSCIVEVGSSSFVNMQIRGDIGGSTTLNNLVLTIIKLEGSKGDKGDIGGTTVNIEQDDSLVSENEDVLNFEGNVTVLHELTKTTITVGGGGSAGSNICQVGDGAGGLNLNNSTPVVVPFNDEIVKDSYYNHSNSTNNSRVVFIEAGWYKVSYSISMENTTNTRATVKVYARKSGSSVIDYSASYSYSRNKTDKFATNTATFLAQFNLNEYIELLATRTGSSGDADMVADESWLTIEYMRA